MALMVVVTQWCCNQVVINLHSLCNMVCKQDGCVKCNALFQLTNMISDENILENEKKQMVKTEAVYPGDDLAQAINRLSIEGMFEQLVSNTH